MLNRQELNITAQTQLSNAKRYIELIMQSKLYPLHVVQYKKLEYAVLSLQTVIEDLEDKRKNQ